MQVTPLTPAIGAEITGLDLKAGPGDNALAELRAVWLERQVVVLRGQDLAPAEQLSLARRIGEPDIYPFLDGIDGFPEVTAVLKREDETVNFGGVWHADTTYQRCPPMATMLQAVELPSAGGDTLFANQAAAFEALSDGLKQELCRLRAISSAAKKAVAATRMPRIEEGGTGIEPEVMQAVHPVVRVHPETGRRSLFVNRAHTVAFEGWSVAESAPLLEFLFAHQVREEFTCRQQWRAGDLVLWDNRACLHYPVNDYHGERRLMHRITLKGDAPAGVEAA